MRIVILVTLFILTQSGFSTNHLDSVVISNRIIVIRELNETSLKLKRDDFQNDFEWNYLICNNNATVSNSWQIGFTVGKTVDTLVSKNKTNQFKRENSISFDTIGHFKRCIVSSRPHYNSSCPNCKAKKNITHTVSLNDCYQLNIIGNFSGEVKFLGAFENIFQSFSDSLVIQNDKTFYSFSDYDMRRIQRVDSIHHNETIVLLPIPIDFTGLTHQTPWMWAEVNSMGNCTRYFPMNVSFFFDSVSVRNFNNRDTVTTVENASKTSVSIKKISTSRKLEFENNISCVVRISCLMSLTSKDIENYFKLKMNDYAEVIESYNRK